MVAKKAAAKTETKPAAKAAAKTETKTATKSATKTETKTATKTETKTETKGRPDKKAPVKTKEPSSDAEEPKPADKKPKVPTVEVNPEGPCPFNWGSYSSTYSTNFTGYTDKGPSLSSDISEAEEHFHAHEDPTFEKPDEGARLKEKSTLKGVVQSAEGLMKAETEGAETYVHVALAGKHRGVFKKEEKSKTVKESDAPKYSLPFDFGEVIRGLAVEFTVFQTHEDGEIPIGYARKEIKDIEADDRSPVEIELSKPSGLKHVPKGFTGPWGKLVVEFDKKELPAEE